MLGGAHSFGVAVVIPRPRIKLLIDHGAFAPRGRCHSGSVIVEDAPHRAQTPAIASVRAGARCARANP
jgi:hypothetical protein